MEEHLLFKTTGKGQYDRSRVLRDANPTKVELILFLNKCDILAKKLESGTRLAKFVPSFKDHPNNVETVTKCEHYSLPMKSFY